MTPSGWPRRSMWIRRSSLGRSGWSRSVIVLGLLALPAFGVGCARTAKTEPTGKPEPSGEPSMVASPPPVAPPLILPSPALARAGTGASIADVVEKVLPSVVSVWSSRATRSLPSPFPFGPEAPSNRRQGLGSGVVVGAGLVVTNHHVVADADEIRLATSDQRELTAKVVGRDPKSDLAVLRVEGDAAGLVPIEFGDSSRLRLGDVVLAIGNPFGVGQTVTMGIVSAKGRANVGIVDYEDFIQTDAAINPGNSGGALVDMEGRLVGINTAILSRSGGNVGIGFAIPSAMARPIIDSLVSQGRVVRGYLGVTIQDVDAELSKALGLGGKKGVLIADVEPNGPAKRAGIERGDVVLSIDGMPVDSTGRLRNLVAQSGAKKKVTVVLLRKSQQRTLEVPLAELPQSLGPSARGPSAAPESLDGLTLEPLTAANRKRFQLGSLNRGVVVVAAEPGSSAARAGLRPGDVILEVDRQAVDRLERFRELYAKSKERVLLLVQRQGKTSFVVVKK